MILTDEIKQKNYTIFKTKMNEIGVSNEKIDEVFGYSLIDAVFGLDTNSGAAFEGSLLHTILRVLTPYALKINDILPDNMKVEKAEIIKVCLLQHLAKTEMFVKNDNNWEIEKLGKLYKFANKKIALRLGMRSVATAMRLGVTLTENELEAMTIIDKDSNDEQAKFYASTLAVIVRQANELTNNEMMKSEK